MMSVRSRDLSAAAVLLALSSAAGAATLSVSSVNVAAAEGDSKVTLGVSKSGPEAVTVDYRTVAGTATAADFVNTAGTLTWAKDATNLQTVDIPLTGREISSNKTFTFELFNVAAGSTISQSTTTVTLNDLPATSLPGRFEALSAALSVMEGDAVTVGARRAGGTGAEIYVEASTRDDTAREGIDYFAGGKLLSLPAQANAQDSLTIQTVENAVSDPPRVFVVRLFDSATDREVLVRVVIIDDDASPAPSIGFIAAAETALETQGEREFFVVRTGESSEAVSVNFRTADRSGQAGQAYQATAGTLNWAEGEAGIRSFTVGLINRPDLPQDQAFAVELFGAQTGAGKAISITTATVEATIQSDNAQFPGFVTFDAPAYHVAPGSVTGVCLLRQGGTRGEIKATIAAADGSARAGRDFVSMEPFTVTWPDQNSVPWCFDVVAGEDKFVEDRTFRLILTDLDGGALPGFPSATTFTIAFSSEVGAGALGLGSAALLMFGAGWRRRRLDFRAE